MDSLMLMIRVNVTLVYDPKITFRDPIWGRDP